MISATTSLAIWLVVLSGTISSAADMAAPDTLRRAAASPLWPLELPPTLTSTFGEYRAGHFHAGLDLSTGGATGYPVRAIDDGAVFRIRASGVGYGRSVYIRLRTGAVVVYGHLDGWSDPLARYVRSQQEAQGRYEVDLFPPAGRFPVGRGEVIGYTGESGAGPPHLHFEMRSRDAETAVNPLLAGYRVADSSPPTLGKVTVLPASPVSLVRGRPFPLQVSPRPAGAGRYVADPIAVTGPIALTVEVQDRADGRSNPLAVHRLALVVDGVTLFESRLDSVAYSDQRDVYLVYDPARATAGETAIRRLFTDRAGVPSVVGDGGGIIRPGEGARPEPDIHGAEIIAADFFGNEARVTLPLVFTHPPWIESCRVESENGVTTLRAQVAGAGSQGLRVVLVTRGGELPLVPAGSGWYELTATPGFEIDRSGMMPMMLLCRDGNGVESEPVVVDAVAAAPTANDRIGFTTEVVDAIGVVDLRLTADRPLVTVDDVRLLGASPTTPVIARRTGPRDVSVRCSIDGLTGEIDLALRARSLDGIEWIGPLSLGLRGFQRGRDGGAEWPGATISVGPDALFSDVCLRGEMDTTRIELPPGLEQVSPIFRLSPDGVVFRRAGTLTLEPGDGADGSDGGVGVYAYASRRNVWVFTGGEPVAGRVAARIDGTGRYCLIRDRVAPRILRTTPREGATVPERLPRIAVRIEDVGSGFGWRELHLYLDGVEQIAEWDPEAGELRAYPGGPLATGGHTARVTVSDRAGNQTETTISFTVAAP